MNKRRLLRVMPLCDHPFYINFRNTLLFAFLFGTGPLLLANKVEGAFIEPIAGLHQQSIKANMDRHLDYGHTYTFSDTIQHFSLQQQFEAWPYYFHWNNWVIDIAKSLGDGGVDVTGAPNSELVEGANQVLVNVTHSSLLRLSIAIPAEGYLTFDLHQIGGSNIYYQFVVNNKLVKPRGRSLITPLLHENDSIIIFCANVESLKALQKGKATFLSNAIGVSCNRDGRFIPGRAKTVEVLNWNSNYQVGFFIGSGHLSRDDFFPIVDQDGDWSTRHDQYSLEGVQDFFNYEWQDENIIDVTTQQLIIKRTWLITDKIHQNKTTIEQLIDIKPSKDHIQALLDSGMPSE